jgi:hypothetical protein
MTLERPVITLLTDFGLDGAVATCKGVILGICRDAQIVDIAHSIRKYAIRDGVFLLRFALPYVPVGVHVAVVDPGVGTARRAIGIRAARGDVLIGPDNGLLPPVTDALGGAVEARELTNREWWLPDATSSTFHGRDIFAPVAAHLAAGHASFDAIGDPLDLDGLVRLAEPTAIARPGVIETGVTYVDSFGNLRLAGGWEELRTAFGEPTDRESLLVEFESPAVRETSRFGTTFGAVPVGESVVYVDSLGNLALADNQGSIATRLDVGHDRPVRISRA